MNRVKLTKVIVEGFRGALNATTLDFHEDAKSIVVFGFNGDGKSTFTDAVEWFLHDAIRHLKREGCGRDDYFNKAWPEDRDAFVRVQYNNAALNATKIMPRKGGAKLTDAQDRLISEFIESARHEKTILRHDDIRQFVDQTKKQKLEALEGITGFSEVRQCREVLLQVLNSLKEDVELKATRLELNKYKEEIVQACDLRSYSETDIYDYCDTIRQKLQGKEAVRGFEDLGNLVVIAEKHLAPTEASDKLLELSRAESYTKDVLRDLGAQLQKLNLAIAKHNELCETKGVSEAAILKELYEAGCVAIEKGIPQEGYCPLCGAEIREKAELLERIRRHLEKLKLTLEDINNNKEEIHTVNRSFEGIKRNMELVQGTKLGDILDTSSHYTRLNRVSKAIKNLQSLLRTSIDRTITFPRPRRIDSLSETSWKYLTRLLSDINAAKESCDMTQEQKASLRNLDKLRDIYKLLTRMQACEKKVRVFANQIASMQSVFDEFERQERDSLSHLLVAISAHTDTYFKQVNPDENIDSIEIKLTEARGLEFAIKFYGLQLSPPQKVLSESHLNCLGICLFLAMTKKFNNRCGFVILDDVINSFDSNHRSALSRVIRDHFSDTQFIIHTHDELWYDQLKTTVPENKWLFLRAMRWSLDDGVRLEVDSTTLSEEIEELLTQNKVDVACNRARVLIEKTLKEKCHHLAVKGLEFRMDRSNDQREASELISALSSYLNGNKTLRKPDQKALFNDIRADQLLTNIGSHHRLLDTTSLSRGDIEQVVRDVKQFEQLFICQNCGSQASRKFSPRNAKLKQCKCGDLKI